VRSYLECIPCFFAQAVRAGRTVGLDEAAIRALLEYLGHRLGDLDPALPPPQNARLLYDRLAELAGRDDPFAEAKNRHTELALQLLPTMYEWLGQAEDHIDGALRLAAAGNIIDLGAMAEVDDLATALQKALDAARPRWDLAPLKEALAAARRILVLGDNAGETVFDRILLEVLAANRPGVELAYSVRSRPIINDATEDDARAAGVDRVATVVPTGSELPGIVLGLCSAEFRELFAAADVVLSKGQGNFETLSEVGREVFFVLTVKCKVVALHLGLPRAASVLLHHRG
jgi:uncharacterized protein with ATP-grasp and redox domains